MKAIIIAAGKATRLLPLTEKTPQCMLKIKGKTILEHQINMLKTGGIKDITVICGYKADKVESFCNEQGIKTILNPFYDVSGIAMTLWIAKEELDDSLIIYSDILFNPEIVSEMIKQKGDICIAIKKDGIREEAEKVVENNGIVESISKEMTPKVNGEFTGMIKLSKRGSKDVTEKINNVAKVKLNCTLIEIIDGLIADNKKISAYDIRNSIFIDIDFPKDLEKAETMLLKR